MKTNYLPRNRTKHPKIQKALLALAGFLVLAFFLTLVHFPLVPLVSPLWKGENAVSNAIRDAFILRRSKAALIQANQQLEEKIRSYEIERTIFSSWQDREQELLALLGRENETSGMVASVLSHSPQNPYDTLVVDVGSNQGIGIGDEARLPEGPLLGVVTEVFSNTAKVKLFSSSGERMNAVLEREKNAVELTGAGGGMFKLSLPRDVAVEVGDKVFSAGIERHLVAIVGDISMRSTDSVKEVLLKSPANIFGLKFVILSP